MELVVKNEKIKGNLEIRKKDLLQDIEELKLLGNQVKSMEEKGYNKKFLLSKDRRQYNKLNHEIISSFDSFNFYFF